MSDAAGDMLVKTHDAVGHELEEIVAAHDRKVATVPTGGDDAGDVIGGQPVLDPVQLLPLRERVVEQRQQHIDGVEHDARSVFLGEPRADARQQAADIEAPGLYDIGRHAGIHEQQFVLVGKVPAERGGVGNDAARIFLEGDKNAAFAVQARTIDQGLQGEHRLAAARPPHHDACAPLRQAAAGDRVKTLDAGGGFCHTGNVGGRHGRVPRRGASVTPIRW